MKKPAEKSKRIWMASNNISATSLFMWKTSDVKHMGRVQSSGPGHTAAGCCLFPPSSYLRSALQEMLSHPAQGTLLEIDTDK